MMKNLTCLFLIMLATKLSFGQKEFKPTAPGIIKEFSGKIVSSSQYDFDNLFWINDQKHGKITLYLHNGSCTAGDDKYAIKTEISNELYEMILSEDSWKDIKVKVIAKSTYGLKCGNCDDCKPKRVIIWRPVAVTRIN